MSEKNLQNKNNYTNNTASYSKENESYPSYIFDIKIYKDFKKSIEHNNQLNKEILAKLKDANSENI
ncbi:MAG: hypothetical protein EHM58_01570 [Ignavibacteriae bacterium]|nr:MAG: hypothetical protein EHM58_01570 [Ignavibacteriota bacterium]